MEHLFGKQRHQLDKIPHPKNVIVNEITKAVIDVDRAGNIPLNKPFSVHVTVEGQSIEVRGIVVDGELKYGTFFIPDGA